MQSPHPHLRDAVPYIGPWPIHGQPVIIGLDLGRGEAFGRPSGALIEGTCSVIARDQPAPTDQPSLADQPAAQGFPAARTPREDPRVLQQQWDHDEQFRAVNNALRGPAPDGSTPPDIALALAIGSAVAGAIMIMGVITLIALVVGIAGGGR